MSRYITGPTEQEALSVQWSVRDTEFLLRLINSSNIPGIDLEQATDVVRKIKSIHAKLLEVKVD